MKDGAGKTADATMQLLLLQIDGAAKTDERAPIGHVTEQIKAISLIDFQ